DALGQRLDRRLLRRPALAVEHARDVEHAARLAYAEESLLVVLFDPVIEAVGVEYVADVVGQPVQVLDRALLGVADPLLLRSELAQVLAQQVSEMADDRGRLVADLT